MELLYGHITALATDTSGVIRTPGQKVVFVPEALPGEDISYSVVSETARYQHGRLGEIKRSAPNRTAPQCPYYGACGGCQLQHLNHQAHLEQKRRWFLETCARIGRLETQALDSLTQNLECVSLQPWHYRQRARFHLAAKGKTNKTRALGFANDASIGDDKTSTADNKIAVPDKITPIETCRVLLPILENSIEALCSVLNSFKLPAEDLQIELTRCHGAWDPRNQLTPEQAMSRGEFLTLSIFQGGRKRLQIDESIRSACLRDLAARGLPMLLPEQGDILRIIPGIPVDRDVSPNAASPFATHRLGFIQPHFQSPSVYRHFVEQVVTKINAAKKVTNHASKTWESWDLYGGSGMFAHTLAASLPSSDTTIPAKKKVTLVESSKSSLKAAKLFIGADLSKSKTRIEIAPSSVTHFLADALKQPTSSIPRIIVADPPRSGLEKAVVQALAKLAQRARANGEASDVVLVSCDPAAAARDIAALVQTGFTIETCLLADAFGQTRHYECLTHLHY